ncbi:MAG: type II and III secretion system protein [Betaproteobacteria bacterium]|nr:type II and III secretion system protein [Betaproteobacteria bacterium]
MIRRAFHTFVILTAGLVGCVQNPVVPDSDSAKHLTADTLPQAAASAPIPEPVTHSFNLPRPQPSPKTETHSVVVRDVKVQELLFALARDAKVNVDIHPGITGTVTLNALDQTLPQLLERIARQVDIRWELQGDTLIVMPDTPFLRSYKVDYVNLARDTSGTVSVTTQIATTATGALASSQAGSTNTTGLNASTGNNSLTQIQNLSRNRFWETLIQNLKDLLRETDKIVATETTPGTSAVRTPTTRLPARLSADRLLLNQCRQLHPDNPNEARKCYTDNGGLVRLENNRTGLGRNQTSIGPDDTLSDVLSDADLDQQVAVYREAASVIANPESGVISVRATSRQHERVQEFLNRVLDSARRQVLIEATIAEVDLSQNYQQGIDWSKLNLSGTGFRFAMTPQGALTAPPSNLFELGYTSSGGSFIGSVKLLESFGTVKVLSSPKLSVLNNQTAVLKVVDNSVYFTIDVNIDRGNQNTQDLITYKTTVNTVPIGLVLNVTPEIGDNDTVLLNIRPSLSRIVGTAIDPNPVLKEQNITNQIPIVRSREIDSVLRVENGNIAVIGGLMEDAIDLNKDTVPLAASLPVIGALFQNRNDTRKKTELVILIRPTVIRQASLTGDYAAQQGIVPRADFFKGETGPTLFNTESLNRPLQ